MRRKKTARYKRERCYCTLKKVMALYHRIALAESPTQRTWRKTEWTSAEKRESDGDTRNRRKERASHPSHHRSQFRSRIPCSSSCRSGRCTSSFHEILHRIESLQRRHARRKGGVVPDLLHSRWLGITPNAPASVLAVPDQLLDHDVLGNVLLLCRLGGDVL